MQVTWKYQFQQLQAEGKRLSEIDDHRLLAGNRITKGEKVMEIEMASSTLRWRRSASASAGGESTKCRPAPSCDKCQLRSNLFVKSKSENHSESKCTDCRLLQKQRGMRKWWTLYMTFVVAVITKITPNESDNFPINNHSISGSHRDHIIDIINPSDITTVSDSTQNQIDQTHQVQHDEIVHHQITIKVTGSRVKLFCRLINVLAEFVLAILTQINGSNKLNNAIYWNVTLVISSFCFIISLIELIVEVRDSRAEWRRRGCCCWFYYPGTQGKLFGNRFLYLGVGSAGIQVIINSITVWKMKKCIKFDLAPLILSIFHLVCYKESFKCTLHGCTLECPRCNEHDSDQIL